MDEHRDNDSKRTAIALISFLALIFVLLSVFLRMHGEKRDYHLYLLGDDLRTTPRILARVVSRDGYLVTDARITLDGRPADGLLLDASRPFRTITLTVGGTSYEYDADLGRILEKSARHLPDAWFTEKEIREAEAAVRRIATAPKRLYVVPDAIRLFGEQPNHITLFCFTDDGPCRDDRVTVGAASFPLNNGIGEGTLIPSFQSELMARFPDDTVVPLLFPYPGKMFSLEKEGERWIARTLVDMNNIHIDCWRGDRWQVTDVVSVPPTGRPLPPHYAACDRIQVSSDPHDPGGNFLVRTTGVATPPDVADPYFRALLDDIGRHRPDAAAILLERYPAAFFRRLNVVFSSIEGEQAFEARKSGRLAIVWWILAAVAAAGIAVFSVFSYRRFTTVVGDEEEPITLSRRQQKLIVIAASVALALFFIVLLSVLRNLA